MNEVCWWSLASAELWSRLIDDIIEDRQDVESYHATWVVERNASEPKTPTIL